MLKASISSLIFAIHLFKHILKSHQNVWHFLPALTDFKSLFEQLNKLKNLASLWEWINSHGEIGGFSTDH